MSDRELVERLIYPDDPDLARRIMSLLWSYERSRLRHSLAHDSLTRRTPRHDNADASADESGNG